MRGIISITAQLIVALICVVGCYQDDVRKSDTAIVGDEDSGSADSGEDSGGVSTDESAGVIPVLDFSFHCYDYRLFSYSSWVYSGGSAYAINESDDTVGEVRSEIFTIVDKIQYYSFKMRPVSRKSQLGLRSYGYVGWDNDGVIIDDILTDTVLLDLIPVDINNTGTILMRGHFSESEDWLTAALHSDNHRVIQLLSEEGRDSRPQALNDGGLAVGYFVDTHPSALPPSSMKISVGYIQQDDGSAPILMSPLPASPVESSVEPYGINNHGDVCGGAEDDAGRWLPFIWKEGVYTLLDTLGGGEGIARDINDAGWVVGDSLDSNDVWRPVLWDGTGIVQLGLAAATSMKSGTARAVNEDGAVIGWDEPSGGAPNNRTWVWKDGVAHDLTSMVNPHTEHLIDKVYDINNSGVIVGRAITDFSVHSYAQSIPEPGGPYAIALVPQDCN